MVLLCLCATFPAFPSIFFLFLPLIPSFPLQFLPSFSCSLILPLSLRSYPCSLTWLLSLFLHFPSHLCILFLPILCYSFTFFPILTFPIPWYSTPPPIPCPMSLLSILLLIYKHYVRSTIVHELIAFSSTLACFYIIFRISAQNNWLPLIVTLIVTKASQINFSS